MPKGQQIPNSLKQEIINQVKQGVPVTELAKQNGIIPNTIYNWLSGRGLGRDDSLDGNLRSITKTNDALTIAKLIKEKQELTEIIGKFAVQIEKLNSVDSKKKLNFRTG